MTVEDYDLLRCGVEWFVR